MSQTRIKICGITRVEDALCAVEAGADAIGLVFYDKSPRAIGALKAREIVDALPPFVTVVGLFVNCPRRELEQILEAVPLDRLQFHGDETPEDCAGYARPWYKALRVQAGEDIGSRVDAYQGASAILLDTYVAGVPGGTGEVFDWTLIPPQLSKPLILAGGLNEENVERAVRSVSPYAVDVSGGVERDKGIKDAAKIKAFIQRVRRM